MKINYYTDKKTITPAEAIELYLAIGWGRASDYDQKSMNKALENSSYLVIARDLNNKLVGLTRVFSDDIFHTHIPEVVVHPDYCRHGIDRKMMELVLDRFSHTGIWLDALTGDNFFSYRGLKKRQLTVYTKKPIN